MKEKKIARDTRNREKLAGDDWVMAEFYACLLYTSDAADEL